MKGLKCHLTKLFSCSFSFCLLFALFLSLLSPLFGSSHANAFELTADVWRVTFSSDPLFQLIVDGTTTDWVNSPYQLTGNSNVSQILIRGNADTGTYNGWTWQAQDFFSIDIAFYSEATSCNQGWPGSFYWRSDASEVLQSQLVGSYNNASLCYTQWNVILSTWSAGSGFIKLIPEGLTTISGRNGFLVSTVSQWRSNKSTAATSGTGEYDKQILNSIQQSTEYQKEQLDAVNKSNDLLEEQTKQQQEQYEQDKQEESDRESQGNEDAEKAQGIFNFNLLNPFDPLFQMFSPNQCVSIPILAGMLNSEDTQYCSWFPQSVRSILTPAFGIVSIMLLFGFVMRWLGGNQVFHIGGD